MKRFLVSLMLLLFILPCACLKRDYATAREEMISSQIVGRGIYDESVLTAMRKVPRHEFVPEKMKAYAYDDKPLHIGEDQHLPQPYIVALMTDLLGLEGGEKVLGIGAGSGYQTAVLAEIAAEVYSIEMVGSLVEATEKKLQEMEYDNVSVKWGDGYQGWEEHAPFDGIVLLATTLEGGRPLEPWGNAGESSPADQVPQPLVDQLKVGGRMVISVGPSFRKLKLLTKTRDGVSIDEHVLDREKLVSHLITYRGISDKLVLAAMRKVPRHEFVLEEMKPYAYEDEALPIEERQTISQPYIVALMTELLGLEGGERVLEIGTGSGYQAAILAEIAGEVYTIEIIEFLARTAEERLQKMGYENITVKCGDGYQGWKEHAPFDGVIVTAAPDHIPQPLVDQLKVGGRMVIPVGSYFQELKVLTKTQDGVEERDVIPVRFVPMTGEAQEKER